MEQHRDQLETHETKQDDSRSAESIARRDFFKRAAQAAATAPAIALLVAATARPAFAKYGGRDYHDYHDYADKRDYQAWEDRREKKGR